MGRLIDAYALECKLRFENGDMSQAVVSEFDIAEAPTIDPVRHGRWYDVGSLSCRCSGCGCKAGKETPYCPNCGTKMDGAT